MSIKYILQPDGSVKKEDRQIISIIENSSIVNEEKTYSSKEINEIVKERAVKSFQDIKHDEGLGIGAGFSSSPINFIESASTNLVTNEDVFVKDPAFSESNTNFPKKDSFLLNPSFGADEGIKYQTDFNSVFTKKGDIFASELEIMAGFDFKKGSGITGLQGRGIGLIDISRYVFATEIIVSSFIQLLLIEFMLSIDKFENNKNLRNNQLGQQGSTSDFYSFQRYEYNNVISKFFQKNLNYPLTDGIKNRKNFLEYIQNTDDGLKIEKTKDILERVAIRLADFVLGFDLFLNTDPKYYFENGKNYIKSIEENNFRDRFLSETPLGSPGQNAALYLLYALLDNIVSSVTSLSGVGENRFYLLIRRLIKQNEWNKNTLYKYKRDEEFILDEAFTTYGQYYLKFIIERMHVGGKVRKFYISKLKNQNYWAGKDFNQINKQITGRHIKDPQSLEIFKTKNAVVKTNDSNLSYYQTRPLKIGIGSKYTLRFNEESKNNKFEKMERISVAEVDKIENILESEHMPFYFQDLRNNEIYSFNAFLESISDSFSANYNETTGYGRIDKVKTYVDTTRNISFTFYIVSTNRNETGLMWNNVNKLVAMLYPQYSDNLKNNKVRKRSVSDDVLELLPELKGQNFKYPFTSVPTNSPMIRIRVGNVITNNLEEDTLSKEHGSPYSYGNIINKISTLKNKINSNKEKIVDKNKMIDLHEILIKNCVKALETQTQELNNLKKSRTKEINKRFDQIKAEFDAQFLKEINKIKKDFKKQETSVNFIKELTENAGEKNIKEAENKISFLLLDIAQFEFQIASSLLDLTKYTTPAISLESSINNGNAVLDFWKKEYLDKTLNVSGEANSKMFSEIDINKAINRRLRSNRSLQEDQKALNQLIEEDLDIIGRIVKSIEEANKKVQELQKEIEIINEKIKRNNISFEEVIDLKFEESLDKQSQILEYFDTAKILSEVSRSTLLKNVNKDFKENMSINKNAINKNINLNKKEISDIKKEIKKLKKQNKTASSASKVLDQGAKYIFNSPFYAAQLSTKGKGLAGFINNLTVDYSEFNWDIDKKTPMCVKLTVQFLPIHDVGPGLDHRGRLKGPVYSKAQTKI